MNEPDEIEVIQRTETVEGIVRCNECDYWGKMEGYITPELRKEIQFVCPKCNSVERVKTPEGM